MNEPLFDTAGAVQATNISGDLQARLPLSSRRDWADFLLVTPGIVSNDAGHVRQPRLDLRCARHAARRRRPRGDVAKVNSLVHPLNPDALEDVQVKTAGIDASAPLGTGVVISMASRSGERMPSTASQGRDDPAEGVEREQQSRRHDVGSRALAQADLSLGGPIRRRRWWFSAAHRLLSQRQEISRSAGAACDSPRARAGLSSRSRDDVSGADPLSQGDRSADPSSTRCTDCYQSDRTPSEFARATDAQRFTRMLCRAGAVQALAVTSAWPSLLTRVLVSRNAKQRFTRRRSARTSPGRAPLGVSVVGNPGSASGPIAFLGNTSSDFRDRSRTWTVSAM